MLGIQVTEADEEIRKSAQVSRPRLPRYKKQDSIDVWLEYVYEVDAWSIKPGRSKGKMNCWAYIEVKEPCLPWDAVGEWIGKDAFQKQTVQIVKYQD